MWLLIDDERSLGVDVIARNAEAGKAMLVAQLWDGLVLDHDLGPGESGYDVLTWALEHGFCPPQVHLVTANPVGRKRMQAALEAAGYRTTLGFKFTRVRDA